MIKIIIIKIIMIIIIITITRYVDGTPTSEVTPVIIRHIRLPHHGQTSQYHGHEWMTHILFVPCQWAVPFLRQSYFRLWPWNFKSKVKVMGVVKGQGHTTAQYHINSLRFHFTLIRPTIPEIGLFRNLTLKHPRSRSWVRSKVKVTYCTSITSTQVMVYHWWIPCETLVHTRSR